ncbi:MAG TPA: hypothetical protein VG474_07275, partial [Solirubrobacteraceae bacterium]|nr:hypothetical protein [Solirubrobacteraceae bacterium]
MPLRRTSLAALAAAAFVAGCADEESGPAGDRPSSTSSAPRRATVTIAPPTATAPPQTTPRRVTVV